MLRGLVHAHRLVQTATRLLAVALHRQQRTAQEADSFVAARAMRLENATKRQRDTKHALFNKLQLRLATRGTDLTKAEAQEAEAAQLRKHLGDCRASLAQVAQQHSACQAVAQQMRQLHGDSASLQSVEATEAQLRTQLEDLRHQQVGVHGDAMVESGTHTCALWPCSWRCHGGQRSCSEHAPSFERVWRVQRHPRTPRPCSCWMECTCCAKTGACTPATA